MAYRRNVYDYVIDSSFRPYSFQEMLAPLALYKQEYEKVEDAYNQLSDKSDKFKYLSETLPEGSKARQMYEGYADELQRQASDLATNGLSINNRRSLTNLRRRYQGEIGRLATADEALQEEKKLRRQMNAKDSSMLYANDNLSIDQFLDGQTPNLYSISGEDLRKEAAQYAQAASSRIYGNTQIQDINKYFQDIIQTQGYSPEVLAAWRQNLQSIPEFNQAVQDIMSARGAEENLTGANYERARQSVINGIMEGSAYQERRTPHQNPGVLTAAQAASNALGWANHNESVRQHNMQIEMQGFEKDEKGNWIYNPEKDVIQKKANATGYDPKDWGLGPDGKWHKKTSKEAEKKETEKPASDPKASFGKDGTRYEASKNPGKPINYAEVLERYPDVAAMFGRNKYNFYESSDGKVTPIPKTAEELATQKGVTASSTQGANGDNSHKAR